MKNIFLFVFICCAATATAQKSYADSINLFISNYVQQHEVVKEKDWEYLRFYPADEAFKTIAVFTKASGAGWIKFPTSGTKPKLFRFYGKLDFKINKKNLQLNIYQSQELMTSPLYKDHLFVAFTDSTAGSETYVGGRYIDLYTTDIIKNKVVLDFNKAYNPYCAYISNLYNCPLPPKENTLPLFIKAGEKNFSKPQ